MDHQLDSSTGKQAQSIVVIGGGLAGITAAWRSISSGYRVTLIERRPFLGGRAYSFTEKSSGREIDNGQHVFLGCCSNYIDLLTEFGTIGMTYRQPALKSEVRSVNRARLGTIKASGLAAPFHLLPSLMSYPHISLRERFLAILAFANIVRQRQNDIPRLSEQSFYDWLVAHNQSDRAIENLWELIILPTLNDRAENVSASMAFMVLREGFLTNRHGADIGLAKTGLSTVMGDAMAAKLKDNGVRLLLGSRAEELRISGNRIDQLILNDGTALNGDWFISALPPEPMLDLLPLSIRQSPEFATAATHTWSPIVNLHIWYDRPVADFEFSAFVDSPIQWVFNKSKICDLPGPGQYLTVSISGAWDLWPKSKQQLRAALLPELERALPRVRMATLEHLVIVKEQKATFRSLPGMKSNRLKQKTSVQNFLLAGDWTDTGWPATMEGAVRSGNLAVEQLDLVNARGRP